MLVPKKTYRKVERSDDMADVKKKATTEFGNFLRDKRIAAGLTQAEVSKQCGFSTPQFLSNIERGVCWPPMDFLRKLSGLYDIDPRDVLSLLMETKSRVWAAELGVKAVGKRR